MMGIDLLASGYEWTCPECQLLNKEINGKTNLECRKCKTKFKCRELIHALSK